MLHALFAFRVLRQLFKGTKAGAKIAHILDKDVHPRTYHAYSCAAVAIYVAHIVINMRHGFEVEGTVTAAATFIELIAHLTGN